MDTASNAPKGTQGSRTHIALTWFAEVAILCGLFLAIDAIVLRYIFPGYFDPFWPHHSDYYMPAAMAYSPAGFWPVLTYPRPVGQVFFWIIGHFKTRGAMVATLLLVAMNYSLIVAITRRLFRVRIDWKLLLSAALFAYMLASHPYQYQMSTWDAFAQLSLLLLLLAVAVRTQGGPLWACAVLVVLAFLAKETFILSAALIATTWFAANKLRIASLVPLVLVACAGATAMIVEHFLSSPFTSASSLPGGPYQVVLSAHSVATQWMQYTVEGMSLLSVAVIIVTAASIAIAFGPTSIELLWSVALPFAGLLALLPNSLLPNHHFAGYSWNAAYLLYAPLIAVAAVFNRGISGKVAAALIAAATMCSPTLSAAAFAKQDWIVMNQQRQKLFLRTFGGLIKELPSGGQRILVSGIDFPFTMFFYKESVRSLTMPVGTRFFVVSYDKNTVLPITAKISGNSDLVTMVPPDAVTKLKFDEAWLIRSDGSLIKRIIDPSSQAAWSEDGFTQTDTLKYPELADVFGPEKREASGKLDGYGYITCGAKMLDYNEPAIAQKCLTSATTLLPDNPYSHYWLGVSLERQHEFAQARAAYQQAIKVQSNSPNPSFQAALDRLQ